MSVNKVSITPLGFLNGDFSHAKYPADTVLVVFKLNARFKAKINVCFKLFLLIFQVVCYSCRSATAMDAISFSVDSITTDEFALKNATLIISHLDQAPTQISLQSATLILPLLPSPFDTLTALDINCRQFIWAENHVACSDGQGRLNSENFKTQVFDFSFEIKNSKSQFTVNRLLLFDGVVSLYAQESEEQWLVRIKAQGVDIEELKSLLNLGELTINQGVLDFEMALNGRQENSQALFFTALLKKLSVQDQQGKLASEALELQTEFRAVKQQSGWQWYTTHLLTGGLYLQPVFLQLKHNSALTLSSKGFWLPGQKQIDVLQLNLEHHYHFDMQGNAQLNYQTGLTVEQGEFTLNIAQLKSATPIYLLPFLESTTFKNLALTGAAEAQLTVKRDRIVQASVVVNNLYLDDTENKLTIKQANAELNWNNQGENHRASFINWQQLNIQAIPFQAGRLDLISYDRQIQLLKPADLDFLGGLLSIKQFSFAATKNHDDANVHFEAAIKNVSLQELTLALNWTPLTGTVSGYIPSVSYQDKTLSLDGKITMQVFDGEITIKNLASSGLFSDFPQFYTDIEFANLDLEAITHTFDFGFIEGRLSGNIQNLYLENWQPVSFYAWLGTPEEDNSRHRISQKAVENIANIGGGGISDVLSRGFMGLFSTFTYQKLGFGCYLYQGVCQLMGVEAVDNGFYLIKGGGLPRIDIIGYNPRLDWDILLNRLSRIEASDEVIVE